MPKVIVFDFDGVLADSFKSFYSLTKDSMRQIKISLSPKQYRDFFIGNVHQGFYDFIKNAPRYSIFTKFRNDNYSKYYRPKLFPGIPNFLGQIHKDYILTIASSGKKEDIIKLLKQNKIEKLFDVILADSSFSKKSMLNEILSKLSSTPEEAIMITDTVGDIRAAKEIGLDVIAVSWGFHNAKMLKSEGPNRLVKNLKELKNILKNSS